MAPTRTKQWVLANHPHGEPKLSGDDATWKIKETDLPELKENQLLLKNLYLSNDPAQRGWIDKYEDDSRLYLPPLKIGQPMGSTLIGEVVESKSDKIKKGTFVNTFQSWSEYSVVDAASAMPLGDLPNGLPITHYIGALGGTGMTAYYGLVEIAETTKDDIVVVSGAAGAVGSMVVQLASKILGCKRVIGIAGGQQKCDWVKSLGAHECIDYKNGDWKAALKKATPDYVNVYFDNVGGEMLDFMFTRIKKHGRVAACGAIASYNEESDKRTGLKNWFEVVASKIRIQGFIVLDFKNREKAVEVYKKALAEGKLDVSKSETVMESKFEDIPKTWMKLFEGANQGKLVTKIVS